jgi:hypothetical protein
MPQCCPFCKNPLMPWYQWRASDGRSYCNEFCADACDSSRDCMPSASEIHERPVQRT